MRKTGKIALKNDVLSVDTNPALELDQRSDNVQLVRALMAANDPTKYPFVGEVMRRITKSDRRRVREIAASTKGTVDHDVWEAFCREAVKWASVVNDRGQWDPENFTPFIYQAEVSRDWIREIRIASCGARFAVVPSAMLTFDEFRWLYGRPVPEVLDAVKATQAAHLDEVIRHCQAKLVRKTLTVTDNNSRVFTIEHVVLESLPPEQWVMPAGITLIAE